MTTDRPAVPAGRLAVDTAAALTEPGRADHGPAARPGSRVWLTDRVRELRRVVLRPAGALSAVVATWWLAVEMFEVRPFFLPAPPDIVAAFVEHGPYLFGEAYVTLGHTLGGFAAAVVAGIVAALGLAASNWLREAVFPLLVGLQAVPKVAVAPLLVVWLGFGPSPKVALVALLCFFPVVVATLSGLLATPAELVELTRSMSATRWQTLTKLRIWYALPQSFVGLKVAMSLALIGAVVAQITTPNSGLGAIIVRSGQAANTPLAFAAITLLAAIGIGLYYTLVAIERLVLPWARATTA